MVAQPAARPASTSLLRSPDHEALIQVNAEFHRRLEDHARFGFAAVAAVGLPVKTSLDRVDRQFARHGVVHSVHFRPGDHAISHVRLVRDYRQQESRSLQPLQTRPRLRGKT